MHLMRSTSCPELALLSDFTKWLLAGDVAQTGFSSLSQTVFQVVHVFTKFSSSQNLIHKSVHCSFLHASMRYICTYLFAKSVIQKVVIDSLIHFNGWQKVASSDSPQRF